MNKFIATYQGHLGKAACIAALASVHPVSAVELPTLPDNFHVVYRLSPSTPAPKAEVDLLLGLAGLPSPQGLGQTVGVTATVSRIFGKEQFVVNPLRPTNFFSLDQSNRAMSFSRDLKRYEGDFEPVLPDEDEAEQIAKEYLTENELMPELRQEEAMVTAAVQTVAGARPAVKGRAPGKDDQPVAFDKLKVLTFTRKINGLPVVGPGSKIVVTLGDGGDVEGLIHRWRSFTPPVTTAAKSARSSTKATTRLPETITPQAALTGMKARLATQFPNKSDAQREAMIQDMDLAYYDGNVGAIQPVYVFRLDLGSNIAGPSSTTGPREDYVTFAPYLKVAPEAIYVFGDLPNSPAPRAQIQPN